MKLQTNDWEATDKNLKRAYRLGLILNVALPIILLCAPYYQALVTCVILFYLTLICSLGVLAYAIYRMRQLMGKNLRLIQYDENAMIFHVISFAVLLLIGLFFVAEMIQEAKDRYMYATFTSNYIVCSIIVSALYFVCMLLMAIVFNKIINRAT